MTRRNVFFPAEIIDDIYKISKREQYISIEKLLVDYVEGKTEYLNLDEEDARLVLFLADIEMKKAILKYPHNEDDDPNYNEEHEAKYDEIMMGIYEKIYYYLTSEFKDIIG